jgi:phosphatidylserine decarboxylase
MALMKEKMSKFEKYFSVSKKNATFTAQNNNNLQYMRRIKKMKVHREGTGLLLSAFTVLFILNLALYYSNCNKTGFYASITVSTAFFLVLLNFFRSPFRRFPFDSEGLVIAPADGTIVAIEEVDEHEYFHDRRIQISVFMSVFNVHANWFPVNGTVKMVKHHPGRFRAAYLPKSSTENERSTIVITTDYGVEVLTRQIAGAMAQRIVTYAKAGDCCDVNEQMGFIKFGSRVDVFLPVGTEILVEMDRKVTGNQTPIARLGKITFIK